MVPGDMQEGDSVEAAGARGGRVTLPAVIEVLALLAFVGFAVTYAIITPPGGAPDESGHTVYATAVSHGQLPTPAERTQVRRGADGEVVSYDCAQAHHPPLYYAIVGGIHALAGRQPGLLTPIGRALSIIAGLAALLLMRAAMHRAWPDRPGAVAAGLALTVASATFTYITGSFNNEPLAVLATCAGIYLAVRALSAERPIRWLVGIGAVLGAGLLAKLTAVAVVVPLAVAALGVARGAGRGPAVRGALVGLAVAVAISGPWFFRNVMVMGTPTFNCAQRPLFGSMAQVVFQPEASVLATGLTLEETLAGMWWPEWLLRDHETWLATMFIHKAGTSQTRPLWMLLLPLAVGGVALGGVAEVLRSAHLDPSRRAVLWVLLWIPMVVTLGIVHQALMVDGHIMRWAGRYVPVMMPPLALAMALGFGRLPRRPAWLLPVLALLLAVAINGLAIYRVGGFYLTL